jgi:DNA-binding GntR family transcriptional regulator
MQIPSQGPTLIEQSYNFLLESICSGQLSPGERIRQESLSAKMNVSRQPVAQALSMLKVQGFVQDAGRRGLVVATIDKPYFLSIYELREALDPLAARLAAKRASVKDIAEARQLIATGRSAVKSHAVPALITCDMQFHMWTYRIAGNKLLVEIMQLYWNHLRRGMGAVLRDKRGRKQVWDEHEAIFKAVAAGDAVTAEKLASRHIKDAATRVLNTLPY